MLTYDDLDHFFDERVMAGLLDPALAPQESASARVRRERILACLHFCRGIPSEQLAADGMHTARRLLRRALRSHQRERRAVGAEALDFVMEALEVLGESQERQDESAAAAAVRHAVEREIEAAAQARSPAGSAVPRLLAALARGDFEMGTDTQVAALEEASRKFNGSAEVEFHFRLDGDSPDASGHAQVRLAIACSLWRWSALPGATVVIDGQAPVPLASDDELLPVMVAGLSAQNGRLITQWAAAVHGEAAGAGPGGLN